MSLMEDYKISPELVVACDKEIKKRCNGGVEREGKTLHCLMDVARIAGKKTVKDEDRMSARCLAEVGSLYVFGYVPQNKQILCFFLTVITSGGFLFKIVLFFVVIIKNNNLQEN